MINIGDKVRILTGGQKGSEGTVVEFLTAGYGVTVPDWAENEDELDDVYFYGPSELELL